jgi:hypothetical protein
LLGERRQGDQPQQGKGWHRENFHKRSLKGTLAVTAGNGKPVFAGWGLTFIGSGLILIQPGAGCTQKRRPWFVAVTNRPAALLPGNLQRSKQARSATAGLLEMNRSVGTAVAARVARGESGNRTGGTLGNGPGFILFSHRLQFGFT